MIEINLFSVPAADVDSQVGTCVARARFDVEALGVGVLQFVKGFIRDNLDHLEGAIGNADLVQLINDDTALTTVDFASLKYLLKKIGYLVTIWNVTEDEENAQTVSAGTVEYNVINRNNLQHDYPTAIKVIPAEGKPLSETITEIVEGTGLFDEAKFKGVKNPFTILLGNIVKENEVMGSVNSSVVSQIYFLLSQMGFDIFCATSEEE